VRQTSPRERLDDDWSGLVVFFGGTAWDGNRFPDQHIAERLSRFVPVLYVDPPLAFVSRHDGWRFRRQGPVDQIGERLARLTPVVPPAKGRGPMRRLTAALARRAAQRAIRSLGVSADVVVAATLLPVFDLCGERLRVLYATDDFRAGASLMGIPEGWVREREAEALAEADVVIAVSDYLAHAIQERSGISPVVIENGVDDSMFAATDRAPTPDDVVLSPPIAGFIGHLSDRIDLPLLEATAETGRSLLLVGPRQGTFEITRMERLLSRPNVQWVGAKPFESLPSYLRVMSVGLLPYADTEFNRASFPLKVLEYLAAGRPAVVSDLPAVRTLGDAVIVARTPSEFASAVGAAMDAPPDPGAAERRRLVAAARSWDAAADRFASAIGVSRAQH
jgi:teichuronic acid biosynthesis glycosyltransferase TuaH